MTYIYSERSQRNMIAQFYGKCEWRTTRSIEIAKALRALGFHSEHGFGIGTGLCNPEALGAGQA